RKAAIIVNVAWVSSAPNSVQTLASSPQGGTLATSSQGVVRLWDAATGTLLAGPNGTSENFARIGHSLLALIVAYLGGRLSGHLYAGGRGQREGDAVVLPHPGATPTS